jgi:osmoprotectant transport system ATP-binding protein
LQEIINAVSAIYFQDVSLKLPKLDRPLLANCNFQVQAGELIVILGPSGCGKTTLLKLVNRLYEATAGEIFIQGRNIRQLPVTGLRRQIGYVIQQAGLFPHMTVASNIGVVPKLLGWSNSRIQARVEELMNLVGLPAKDYRHRFPAQLSGGQQQRVGLVRALAADPALMLMDEPFGALDAITRSSLQQQLLQLQRQLHKTILFVSHDIEEALLLGDRLLILDRGQIIQFDTPLNILLHPVNFFVQELVGTEDTLRRLSLLSIGSVMTVMADDDRKSEIWDTLPRINHQQNLRQALSLLLQSGTNRLVVVKPSDENEHKLAIGTLTLEQIQQAARPDYNSSLNSSLK